MQGKSLIIELTDTEILKMMRKYHFVENDYEQMLHLYYALQPLLHVEAFLEYDPGYEFIEYERYVVVAVTLGESVDHLIALYSKAGKVLQAYMIDCIGLELLLCAYREIVKEVHVRTGLWAQKMDFLGDKYPIHYTKEILHHMQQQQITCNESFMMRPQKSTMFVTELRGRAKKMDVGALCENCSSLTCPNRSKGSKNMNYGYQKIFSKERYIK